MAQLSSYTFLVATSLALPTIALAGPAAGQNDDTQVDARAKDLLKQVSDHLSSAQSLSANITHSMSMEAGTMRQNFDSHYEFALQQPNKLALVLKEGMMGETIVSDGEHIYTHLPSFNAYTEEEAPDNLKALYDHMQTGMAMGGGPMGYLAPLLSPGEFDGKFGTVQRAVYNGSEEKDGVTTHHLSFTATPELPDELSQQMRDEMGMEQDLRFIFDAWVEAGDEPTLRKLEFDLTEMLSEMIEQMAEQMPELRNMKYEMTIAFADWKVNDELPDDTFAFKAPEGSQKVDSFFDAMAQGGQQQGGPDELLGEPAPEFEMQLLDGGTLTSATHRGTDIVILDFWATWCGPCIRAMPALMEVAEEYKDRNVVFYAVNVREQNATIEQFLERQEWSLKVPLDRDGSVGNKFKVGGIPQTVIIDKDGTVQAVHVGFSSNLKQQLSRELDTLLSGQKLAQPQPGDDDAVSAR